MDVADLDRVTTYLAQHHQLHPRYRNSPEKAGWGFARSGHIPSKTYPSLAGAAHATLNDLGMKMVEQKAAALRSYEAETRKLDMLNDLMGLFDPYEEGA